MDTKQRDALVAQLTSTMDPSLVEDVIAVVADAVGDLSDLERIDIASLVAPRLAAHLTDVLAATVPDELDDDLATRLADRIREEATLLAGDVARAVAASLGSGAAQLVVDLDHGNLTVEGRATVAHRLAVRGGDELSRLGIGVHGNAERLSIKVEGDVATITGSGNLTVTAPPEMFVDLSTESGNLSVSGFSSGALVRVSDGNIFAKAMSGPFDAGASSGNINVSGCFGQVLLMTEEGNIHLEGEFAGGEATAAAGNVHLSKLTGGDLDVEAECGNVHLALARDLDLHFDVEGHNLPSIPGGSTATGQGLDGEVRIRAGGNVHIGVS